MSSHIDEVLSWLALRYVLGELTDSDRTAFEARLADDLAACEAVTDASRLVLSARSIAPRSMSVSTSVSAASAVGAGSQRGAWMTVVATSAAVALLSLVALRIPDTTESSSRVAVNRGPSAAELVSRWRSSVDAGDIESDDVEGDISDDDVAVPSWMLAAVSFEAGAFEPDAFDPGPFDADAIDAPSNKTREN